MMEQITAPFGEIVELRQVFHETGVRLLRVIIRDGRKSYAVDLDAGAAFALGTGLLDWAQNQ